MNTPVDYFIEDVIFASFNIEALILSDWTVRRDFDKYPKGWWQVLFVEYDFKNLELTYF